MLKQVFSRGRNVKTIHLCVCPKTTFVFTRLQSPCNLTGNGDHYLIIYDITSSKRSCCLVHSPPAQGSCHSPGRHPSCHHLGPTHFLLLRLHWHSFFSTWPWHFGTRPEQKKSVKIYKVQFRKKCTMFIVHLHVLFLFLCAVFRIL